MPRHFRFGHIPESADDGVTVVAILPGHTDWDCRVCSYENKDRSHCWQCSQERGTWQCGCGRLNKKGDSECSDCGTPRPEEFDDRA